MHEIVQFNYNFLHSISSHTKYLNRNNIKIYSLVLLKNKNKIINSIYIYIYILIEFQLYAKIKIENKINHYTYNTKMYMVQSKAYIHRQCKGDIFTIKTVKLQRLG